MYQCIFACMHVCVCVCMWVCMYACTHACLYVLTLRLVTLTTSDKTRDVPDGGMLLINTHSGLGAVARTPCSVASLRVIPSRPWSLCQATYFREAACGPFPYGVGRCGQTIMVEEQFAVMSIPVLVGAPCVGRTAPQNTHTHTHNGCAAWTNEFCNCVPHRFRHGRVVNGSTPFFRARLFFE